MHNLHIVFWETTQRCNLNCLYCKKLGTEQTNELETKEVIESVIKPLSGIAKRQGSEITLILSGGEPLLRRDIFDISKYASQNGINVCLATNGTLISNSIAKDILNYGIKVAAVSIDGASAKTHDKFRGSGNFELAIKGLESVRKIGLATQINYTVSTENVNELDDVYKLALDLKVNAIHFFLLVPVGCGLELSKQMMLLPDKMKEVLEWICVRSRDARLYCKATCAPYYQVLNRQLRCDTKEATTKKTSKTIRGCLAGINVCFVSYQGDIFPCGYLPVNCGNIKEERLEDIWLNSSILIALRDYNNLKGICGECSFKKICGGCRARAYSETGDFMFEDRFCPIQKEPYLMQLPKQFFIGGR